MSFGRLGTPTLGAHLLLPDEMGLAHVFSETPGYVCELAPDDVPRFESLCKVHNVQARRLGRVIEPPELHVEWLSQSAQVALVPLATAWRRVLNRVLFEEVAV